MRFLHRVVLFPVVIALTGCPDDPAERDDQNDIVGFGHDISHDIVFDATSPDATSDTGAGDIAQDVRADSVQDPSTDPAPDSGADTRPDQTTDGVVEDIAPDAMADLNEDSITEDQTFDTSEDLESDAGADLASDTDTDLSVDTTDMVEPPVSYELHEWGVTVIGPEGPIVHGPTPRYSGPMPAVPIVYIYTEDTFDLDVGVSFASGEATEVWPTTALGPTVQWSNLHVSPGPCETTPFPLPWDHEEPVDMLCEACNLDRCVVESAACLTHGEETAKLLFYTGRLPDYEAPIAAEVDPPSTGEIEPDLNVDFALSNLSDQQVDNIWLVYRDVESNCFDPSLCPVVSAQLAWGFLENMAPGEHLELALPIVKVKAEIDEYGYVIPGSVELPEGWLEQSAQLTEALEASGLTTEEAAAFMNAWEDVLFGVMGSDSFFVEPLYSDGGAVLYLMSSTDYDEQLVLETSIPADKVVRVGLVYENAL